MVCLAPQGNRRTAQPAAFRPGARVFLFLPIQAGYWRRKYEFRQYHEILSIELYDKTIIIRTYHTKEIKELV